MQANSDLYQIDLEVSHLAWCKHLLLYLPVSLQGYLPANAERRASTLQRKRQEYFGFIEQYYDSRNDEHHQDTYRQVTDYIPWLFTLLETIKTVLVEIANLKKMYINKIVIYKVKP